MENQEPNYWDLVAAARRSITTPTVFIASNYPGVSTPVSEAIKENAARHIARGKHRLATTEEISRFHKEQEERAVFCRDTEARNNDRTALAEATRQLIAGLSSAQKPQNKGAN